ncbi:ABC transporter ATP-binding protein/permease wht-3 [Dirofilaria immitis]|nr:ABC transporter ATP-binding protein/permease wht-3 [Dirofilaria immitis]
MRQYLKLRSDQFQAELIEHGKASISTLIYVLFLRSFKENVRNPSFLWAKLIQKVIMGLFWDGINNIKGALFYYISELTYSTVFGIQTFLPSDFPLLVREYHDGIYPVICYYLSKISPSYAIAVSISGPLLTIFSITGGLYSNIKTIHESVRWIQYFSWFRFGYESLIINEFSHYDNISCLLSNGEPASMCEDSGKSVINNLNFETNNMYMNMGAMVFYILCVFIIGYTGLVLRVQLAR